MLPGRYHTTAQAPATKHQQPNTASPCQQDALVSMQGELHEMIKPCPSQGSCKSVNLVETSHCCLCLSASTCSPWVAEPGWSPSRTAHKEKPFRWGRCLLERHPNNTLMKTHSAQLGGKERKGKGSSGRKQ